MVDRLFPYVYGKAHELGMVLTILSNGSRLWQPRMLDLLTTHRPHRITLSIYGATADSYDGLIVGLCTKQRPTLSRAVASGG